VQGPEGIKANQVNVPRCLRQVQGPEGPQVNQAMVERDPVLGTRLRAAEAAVTDRQVALEAAEGVPTLQLVATAAAAADEDNRRPRRVHGVTGMASIS
jgi:hypothetical protein